MLVNNVNHADFIGETDFSILGAGHARFGLVRRAQFRCGIPVVAHHDADLCTAFVGGDFIVPTFCHEVIGGRDSNDWVNLACAQVIVSTLELH